MPVSFTSLGVYGLKSMPFMIMGSSASSPPTAWVWHVTPASSSSLISLFLFRVILVTFGDRAELSLSIKPTEISSFLSSFYLFSTQPRGRAWWYTPPPGCTANHQYLLFSIALRKCLQTIWVFGFSFHIIMFLVHYFFGLFLIPVTQYIFFKLFISCTNVNTSFFMCSLWDQVLCTYLLYLFYQESNSGCCTCQAGAYAAELHPQWTIF